MSLQRFTLEFKEKAVGEALQRSYSIAEVGAQLGISTHSLDKWVKAFAPTKDVKQAAELSETNREIVRRRAQMRRLEEERDRFDRLSRKSCGSSISCFSWSCSLLRSWCVAFGIVS